MSQGDLVSKRFPIFRVAIMGIFGIALLFGLYIWKSYEQVEQAFLHPTVFSPTRIFSDVTRIYPSQTRSWIEQQLERLNYKPESKDRELTFQLREIEYPDTLLPNPAEMISLKGKTIHLQFENSTANALLESIEAEGQVREAIFLEPELVATLSRSGLNSESGEIREFVHFEDIPAEVWKSIIAVEDQNFLDHRGFDPKAFVRAVWVNLKTLSFAQGGSTLTQQLIKNLSARRSRNVFKKFSEFFLAFILEMRFEKEAILERYLNEVYLGQVGSFEIHGVSEGAKFLFGKTLDQLNTAEIALMAGLIRGPAYYSPYRHMDRALQRQGHILSRMVETGQIAPEEAVRAKKQPIRLAPPQTVANKSPYFTDFVKAELSERLQDTLSEEEISAAGFRIYTTLDPTLNQLAQRAVKEGVARIPAPEPLQGILLSVEHQTGSIKTMIGGTDYAQSTFNRILNMKRQAGSTFKPIVYLTALMKGKDESGVPYGGGYPIEDSPLKIIYDQNRKIWSPKNYTNSFLGWIPLRKALAESINTAAARVGASVGVDSVIETAELLGISGPLPTVPSLFLGSAEVAPIELLRAYSTIANHGVSAPFNVIRSIATSDGKPYMDYTTLNNEILPRPETDQMIDLLKTVVTEGTAKSASALGFDREAAGKTGTTNDYRDAWFVGFTPEVTTLVWVGPDRQGEKGSTPIKLTGGGSALPIWVNYMKGALAGFPATTFDLTGELTEVKIDMHTGLEAKSSCPLEQVVTEHYPNANLPGDSSCEEGFPESKKEFKL